MSNVAVIIVRIVFISLFFFYCLLLNHSFPTNPNKITNCFKLFLFYLQLYKLHLLNAFVYFWIFEHSGGYDNESIAMTAMCATFYFWCRSLRGKSDTDPSWLFGIITGIAYIYMVAAWGGYIFVLNMIAFHALVLVALGKYSKATQEQL